MSAAPFNGDVVGLTVDQYHLMIEKGILEEGAAIELLDGLLIRTDRAKTGEDPNSVCPDHVWTVENLRRVLQSVNRHAHQVIYQPPVVIVPDAEPEPDAAIVRGTLDDYRGRKPTASDVSCVIEVADSSLHRDRTTKQRISPCGAWGARRPR